jgi:hypothetical protein
MHIHPTSWQSHPICMIVMDIYSYSFTKSWNNHIMFYFYLLESQMMGAYVNSKSLVVETPD